MKDIIIYLAEVSLFLSMFFLIYKLFLQSSTFLKFNRVYFITGLISSFILPFIHFSYDVPSNTEIIVAQSATIANMPETSHTYIWRILLMIYSFGIIIFTFQNLMGYARLAKLIKSGKIIKNDTYILVDNAKVTSPFTVFKYIVLNTSKLSKTEFDLILKHEIIHVTQKHWLDLICSQCALILQWFNPFVWLYVSALKENHEFLADRAVLDTGCSPTVYKAVLINQRFQGPVFSFTNSFNYSNYLKRLTMMKKMKSSPLRKLAVLILIPAFGTFFWLSATPNYVNKKATEQKKITTTKKGIGDQNSLNLPADKQPLYIVDGKEVADIGNIDPSSIDSMSVLKDQSMIQPYGEKGKNGVVIIKLKK